MNAALNAVRYANSAAFTDTPKLASKTAKRAFLRHLADMSRWSCDLYAYLADRQPPKCDHRGCEWLCFQSEPETADELSMSESAVKRTRRALIADEWIKVTQDNAGRASRTFYTLNRVKLLTYTKQKHEKRCRMPACLIPPTPPTEEKESTPPLFPDNTQKAAIKEVKGGNMLPEAQEIKDKGGQHAPTRGAMCSEKGGNVPSLIRKNRNEPSSEPKAIAIPHNGPSDLELELVYQAYPKHIGKAEAFKAIRAAVRELGTGQNRPTCSVPEALEVLHQKAAAFAASPAGKMGKYTPHPATWFNQGRYHDDEMEWYATDQGSTAPNRGQAREDSIINTYRRVEALANPSAARLPADGTQGGHGGTGIALIHTRP